MPRLPSSLLPAGLGRGLPDPVLPRRVIETAAAADFRHPFNPAARRLSRSLGDAVGLARLGIHLVRVRPGDDTTELHAHEVDEEFVYILEGEALLRLGDERRRVGAGDFLGFAPGHPPHMMTNTGEGDLVYLLGGTRSPLDICRYPRLRRRLVIAPEGRYWVEDEHLEAFSAAPAGESAEA